jgi:hypothetical protein
MPSAKKPSSKHQSQARALTISLEFETQNDLAFLQSRWPDTSQDAIISAAIKEKARRERNKLKEKTAGREYHRFDVRLNQDSLNDLNYLRALLSDQTKAEIIRDSILEQAELFRQRRDKRMDLDRDETQIVSRTEVRLTSTPDLELEFLAKLLGTDNYSIVVRMCIQRKADRLRTSLKTPLLIGSEQPS